MTSRLKTLRHGFLAVLITRVCALPASGAERPNILFLFWTTKDGATTVSWTIRALPRRT